MSPNKQDARSYTSFEKGHWRMKEEARQNAGTTSLVDMMLPFSPKGRRLSNAVCRLLDSSKDADSVESERSTEETTTSLTISPIMVIPSVRTRTRGVPPRSSENEGQTDTLIRYGTNLPTPNIPLNPWNLEGSEIRTVGPQRRNYPMPRTNRQNNGSDTRHNVHESSLHESGEHAFLPTDPLPTKSAHLETKSVSSSHTHHGTITNTTTTTPKTMNTSTCHHNQSPTGSLKRSRAITIKRPSQSSVTSFSETRSSELEHVAAEEESNTRMYDMATWRMYNRIVDHRKHQYFTSHHSTEESVRTDQMGYPISQSMLVSELSSDCLPGEVFELEM